MEEKTYNSVERAKQFNSDSLIEKHKKLEEKRRVMDDEINQVIQ